MLKRSYLKFLYFCLDGNNWMEKDFIVPAVVPYVYHCGKPAMKREKEMNLLKKWLM